MKNQALFSSKDKSKKLKCRLLQFLFGALRVKGHFYSAHNCQSPNLTSQTVILSESFFLTQTVLGLLKKFWCSFQCQILYNIVHNIRVKE